MENAENEFDFIEGLTSEETLLIGDLPITLKVRLGHTDLPVRKILNWQVGSVIELDKLAGEPLMLYANETPLFEGEAVVVSERFALRLTDLVDRKRRTE